MRRFDLLLIFLLLGAQLAQNAYAYRIGDWSIDWALPLHMCDLGQFLLAYCLWRPSPLLSPFAFCWGFGGAIPALLYPEINHSFPHPYFFFFYLNHGITPIAASYLATTNRVQLNCIELFKVGVVSNAIGIALLFFNPLVNGNYWFVSKATSTLSPLTYVQGQVAHIAILEMALVAILLTSYYWYKTRLY